MAKHERLRKEADVLFLLKRKPALAKVLRELNIRLSTTGALLPLPFDGCPFNGCPLDLDLRDIVVNPAARRRTVPGARTATLKRTARKRTKPA
jgi:hypothetical protein